ncbi:MAG: CoA protein activase [Clostridiales bacterium]|nr:CoA protein activase [Clostridiales bacterium]MCF8021237.1 CoA protein activase [Clostridiales bacterium]
MRVTFPHMGDTWIGVKAMLEYLDVEVLMPPPCTKKTMVLGSEHAPEFACMPLKLNLGNYIEASELGANTIMMTGGCGPCRLGYYAQVQDTILQDLGYSYKMVVLEPPEKHITELFSKIRYITGNNSWWKVIKGIHFGYSKIKMVDELNKKACWARPREINRGDTDRALESAKQKIINVEYTKDLSAVHQEVLEIIDQVPVDKDRDVIKIGIVGEIFTLLEPFINFDIERRLGYMGAEVDRSLNLSEWINDHLFLSINKKMRSCKESRMASPPYLNHNVGGHGQETIGSTVLYARRNFDGVIQLLPFTCMPEIVAQTILPGVSNELSIPVLTLIMDEHSGEAGTVTRLEAFMDLLSRKKQKKEVLA